MNQLHPEAIRSSTPVRDWRCLKLVLAEELLDAWWSISQEKSQDNKHGKNIVSITGKHYHPPPTSKWTSSWDCSGSHFGFHFDEKEQRKTGTLDITGNVGQQLTDPVRLWTRWLKTGSWERMLETLLFIHLLQHEGNTLRQKLRGSAKTGAATESRRGRECACACVYRLGLLAPDPSHSMMKVTLLLSSSSHFVIVNFAWK